MARTRTTNGPDVGGGANSAAVAASQLRSFVERIERLNEEKKDIASDIKDIFAEAKGNGFDTKALRTIIRRRAADAAELAEQDALVDLYSGALGMAPPSGEDDD